MMLIFFSEGLAAIKQDNRWGFVDKKGTVIIACQFDETLPFSQELACVRKQGDIFYVDKEGRRKFTNTYKSGTAFSQGLALVNGNAFIDMQGHEVFKIKENPKRPAGLEIAIGVPNNEHTDLFNISRAQLGPFKATTTIHYFKEDLAVVSDGTRFGYADKSGRFVITPQFDYAYPFSEGPALVLLKGKFGYINKQAQLVIPAKYQLGLTFSEGLAAVQQDSGKWGFVNKEGKLSIKCRYDSARKFSEGLAKVGTRYPGP